MKAKRLSFTVAVVFIMASGCFADLIINGGVEGGTGIADLPSWTSWGPSGTLEGNYFHGGAQCARFWWDDTGLFQNFNVTVGVGYTAQCYFYTPTADRYTWNGGNSTYTSLKIEWYQADNTTPAGASVETAHFTPDDAADTWAQRTVTGTAPVSAVYGRVVVAIGGAAPGSGTVAFDDVSVNAVPEPATVALLGGGALIAMLARRKRK
ncbi:MAG: PEP-CTERM sorting domain-containing protein [Lentisphaerota bacterium]